MKNKSLIFSIFLVFIIVFSVSAISAQDVNDTLSTTGEETVIGESESFSGTVSGDVDVVTENPWNTTGELSYDIPADAKTIKSADVYVNVYSGSAKNTYGANANITISTANGEKKYDESLWIEEGSTDGTVYTVNNHTTKCYSDYMIHYDVTSLLDGLNGSNLKIKVDTFKMENKSFDGRIKLIGLVLAYDDGDSDVINYWVNDNQIWTNSNTTLIFDTSALTDVLDMSLTNIALSGQDATYLLNGEFLTDAEHKSGDYYQYNKWDITDYFNSSKKTEFTAIGTAGSYGVSYKNALSVLTAKPGVVQASVSLASERKNSNLDIIYPGTFNQFTINVNTNKNGKYRIVLLADGVAVNSTEVYINSSSKQITLNDDTVRPVDNTTVSTGASGSYNKVNYTAQLFLKDELLNESSINAAILYDGYLSKDYAYPNTGLESFLNVTISGDIVIDVAGAYASGTANRVDTWNVALDENSTIVKAFVYAPYCYGGADDENLYNVTFNGVKPSVVSFSRDQANIVSTSGYGLIVYDVTDSIKAGENTFVLNKTHSTGAYPSILIYLYNSTNSNEIKNVYIYNGADLVGMTGNGANRPISVDSVLKVDSSKADSAVAYIFGAGAKDDRASIVVNGEKDDDAWNTTLSDQINIYTKDISKNVKDDNEISIILNNNMFTALQQIIVTSTVVNPTASVSVATERKNSNLDIVYPGTFNQLTITATTDKHGVYTVKVLADGVEVNSSDVSLPVGKESFTLIDNTIRPVDNTTVSTGASGSYNKVNYTVQLLLDGKVISESSIDASILYNGYLSKDYAYPNTGLESFLNVTISGDIVIEVAGAYASGTANRVDTWNVTLTNDSTIVKAFVYAPYCYGGADDVNLYNVTFNDVIPSVVSFSRDQANIVSTSGYGLIVYDVTDSIKAGENTFVLNKTHSTGAYPSILIYLYNTTGSTITKNVYIYNGADLVGMTGNGANRPISVDSVLKVDSSDVAGAVAYIFGAGAKDDRASIVVNGEKDDDAWNTNLSDQINIYAKDISSTVKDNNDISIILNNNMFTALQQIVVLTKKETPVVVKNETKITAPSVTKVYNVAKNLVVTLKDTNGKAISDAKITVNLNGKTYTKTTNAKGQATVAVPNLVPKTYTATVNFAGNDDYKSSTLKTKVVVKKATPKMTGKTKVTYKVKTKTKKYTIVLKNNKKQAMKKVKVTLKVKGKTYKATTNTKGKAVFKITKLTKKGKYTAKVKFAGNKYYKALTKTVKITVK